MYSRESIVSAQRNFYPLAGRERQAKNHHIIVIINYKKRKKKRNLHVKRIIIKIKKNG